MVKPGIDADGIAQTEADHFMKCPGCGQWFDMRDLGQVLARARWRNAHRRRRLATAVRPAAELTLGRRLFWWNRRPG
jgi:uncharacterized C2H2 Zn-finger protein